MSTTMEATPRNSLASAPFDILTADVVIRTSDNVDFYIFKPMLAIASTFFATLFSLTQPSKTPGPIENDPIIISEDSQTFDCLMRFIYPVDDPVFINLNVLERVLEAALKYDMAEAVKLTCAVMRTQFLHSCPLDVYAIACRLHVEEEARRAAETWNQTAKQSYVWDHRDFNRVITGASFVPRMAHISAGAYYRLLQFLRAAIGTDTVRFTDGRDTIGNTHQVKADIDENGSSVLPVEKLGLYNVVSADTTLLSSDSTRFPVHSLVLRLAGAEKFLEGEPGPNGDIQTGLDRTTLSRLLRVCYPLSSFAICDFSSVHELYKLAHKLQIHRVIEAIRARFQQFRNESPINLMSMYFIASEQGWRAEAQDLARIIAKQGVQKTYTPEMDANPFSAMAYYRLLKLCHKYTLLINTNISAHTPHATSTSIINEENPVASVLHPLVWPIAEELSWAKGSQRSHSYPQIDTSPSAWRQKSENFEASLNKALSTLLLETDETS